MKLRQKNVKYKINKQPSPTDKTVSNIVAGRLTSAFWSFQLHHTVFIRWGSLFSCHWDDLLTCELSSCHPFYFLDFSSTYTEKVRIVANEQTPGKPWKKLVSGSWFGETEVKKKCTMMLKLKPLSSNLQLRVILFWQYNSFICPFKISPRFPQIYFVYLTICTYLFNPQMAYFCLFASKHILINTFYPHFMFLGHLVMRNAIDKSLSSLLRCWNAIKFIIVFNSSRFWHLEVKQKSLKPWASVGVCNKNIVK